MTASQEPSAAAAGERAMIEPQGAIHFSLLALGQGRLILMHPSFYIYTEREHPPSCWRSSFPVIQVKYTMETWSVIELIKAGHMNTHRGSAACTAAEDANRPHQCTHAEQAQLYEKSISASTLLCRRWVKMFSRWNPIRVSSSALYVER
jgi:hypothetical protein